MNELNGKLNEAETIFSHLLDDDKMFNQQKFFKALQQQKIRRVEVKLRAELQAKEAKQKQKKGQKVSGTKSNNQQKGQGNATPLNNSAAQGEDGVPAAKDEQAHNDDNSNKKKRKKAKDKDEEDEDDDKKKKEKKKRAKQHDLIDIYGEQYQGTKKIEGYSFFSDLNYGDMALVFENPFYDFQLKERQEIEQYQISFLRLLGGKTKGKVNLSPKETKRMEKMQQVETQRIQDKYTNLSKTLAKQNIRIDLEEAYNFYLKYINLKPENQIESRKDELFQKQAFANALIFFSDRYYVNDMARIKVGSQPYSDAAPQSLRDFLVDLMFEFSLFHKIAKRRFYTEKEGDTNLNADRLERILEKDGKVKELGKSKIGGSTKENPNPLGEIIQSKKMQVPNIIQRALSKNQQGQAFHQIFDEETNFFFIKRPEIVNIEELKVYFPTPPDSDKIKDITRKQYNSYIELTKALTIRTKEFIIEIQRKMSKKGRGASEDQGSLNYGKADSL